MFDSSLFCPAVVPVLVGPLQVLLTILPGLLLAMLGGIVALFKPSGLKNLVRLLWQQKIAVVLFALIVTGVVLGYRSLRSEASAGPSGEAQQGSDWTMARFDLRRTGAVPGTPSPMRPKLIWTFKQGNEGFLSSPAVVGNRVYVASAAIGAFSKKGMIFCFDADTGNVVWANAPEGFRPTFSSPVIVGNYLVCGEGLHDTRDARVVCLDISEEKRGEIVWTFETKNHVECTPVVAGGRVFVGAGDDGYYCLDLKPGADGKARVLWHLPTEQYPDAETSLAVHDGKVYAGLGNEGQALCVLDAATGKELQRLAMPYPVFSPPSIDQGKIFLGMGKGDYVNQGEGGEARCLNLATLKTEWSFPLDQTVLGAIAVKEDKLYFGSRDGHVYCLARNGKLVGKFDAHAPIVTSPAVTDQAVYVVTDAGLLFALDRHTLEPLWEFRLGNQPFFISSPVVARGHVYVGTQNDGFLCIGEPSNERIVPLWANPLGGPGRAGNKDNSPFPAEAKVYWRFPDVDGTKEKGPMVPAAIACWGDDLYVPFSTSKRNGIACLSRKAKPDVPPEPRWVHKTSGKITQSPVVLDDLLLFAEESGGKGTLHCVDRGKGTLRWKKESEHGVGPVTIAGQHIFVQNLVHHRVTCLDRAGVAIWSTPAGAMDYPPAVSAGMLVYFDMVLDRQTGVPLWLGLQGICTAPFVDRTSFLVGTDLTLEARSLLDGKLLPAWQCDGGIPSADFAVRGQAIYYVNKAGDLVAVERATGKVKWRVGGALPGLPPLVSRGQALIATKRGLTLVPLDQDEPQPQPWLDLEAYGPPVAPMVLHDSRVYVPTRRHGLVCIGGEK